MRAVRDIAVVGAGLAGLACALAAAAAGAQVDVFESAAAPANPAAHIDVVPNLLRDLVGLGVGDACLRAGFAHCGLIVVDGHGKPQFEIPAPHLAGDGYPPALGMVYGELLGVLVDAACSAGARLHWAHAVEAIDGSTADTSVRVAQRGAWRADLVLLASGADGALRRALHGDCVAAPADQDWWYTLLPRPPGLDRATWAIGNGGAKAHLVPVAADRAGVALLRPVDAARHALDARARAASLRGALQAHGTALKRLAAWVDDTAPVVIRPVRTAPSGARWFGGAVLSVGDAAHPMAPHFGQAAAQSLEDAVVLGELLGHGRPVGELLAQFVARRSARAERVQAITAQAARWDLRPDAHTDLRALSQELARLVTTPA